MNDNLDLRIKLENILALIEEIQSVVNMVDKHSRSNEYNDDVVIRGRDADALYSVKKDIDKAIELLKPLAGY